MRKARARPTERNMNGKTTLIWYASKNLPRLEMFYDGSFGSQLLFAVICKALSVTERPRVRNPAMNTSCFSFRAVSSHLSVSPQLPAHGHIPGSSHGAHHHPYSKNVNLKNLKNQCTNVYVLCT
ncbi:hypothetical protein FHG87_021490 [Trinorchestia longiramus]|nr:hypothetical protein FHG87_021490 [Trinorchestia longiramus]